CLYTGPNFGQSILDILLRFRLHEVALVGDVEKAFLMVSVVDRDRDILQFLWIRDYNRDLLEWYSGLCKPVPVKRNHRPPHQEVQFDRPAVCE
ncbi:MAG: hypothetical protein MJE68_01170, partial [Proteobacteria bacterium]|nr:hypothetical protein [Pseudomonadota bacterium]